MTRNRAPSIGSSTDVLPPSSLAHVPPVTRRMRRARGDQGDRLRCGCGGSLREADSDGQEILDYGHSGWRFIRSSHPSFRCDRCGDTALGRTASNTLPDTAATFAALAHIIMARYDHYQPLDHQAAMMADCGVPIKRASLADWIGATSALLAEVAEEIRNHGLGASIICAANAPVAGGEHDSRRFWAYVVDDRAWQHDVDSLNPPLAWYRFTLNRSGAYAANELAQYSGILQATAHGGYNRLLASERISPAGCWEDIRQKAVDIQRRKRSDIAAEIIDHIDMLNAIERTLRGAPAARRLQARTAQSALILESLRNRLRLTSKDVARRSSLGELLSDILKYWPALTRFIYDGRIEIDNSMAENALRLLAVGRHSWVIGRTRESGSRAAAIYTIIETCKRNAVDPCAYITWVLPRLAAKRTAQPLSGLALSGLMPWHWKSEDSADR